jgi:tripartite-type tricarboxylate transporter receptor subunit TctC
LKELKIMNLFNSKLSKRDFLLTSALLPGAINLSLAQSDYPNKPIKLIFPFGPGAEVTTRAVLKSMSDKLGQPFIIDFKPGASTNIGAALAAQAAPDGYTLFFSTIGSNVLNKLLHKNLTYDPDSLVPIGLIGQVSSYLIVRNDSPFKSVDDLVKAAKSTPTGLSYGTHAIGGPNHLVGELFKNKAGIKELVHVAYKGLNESSTDLIAGRIDFMWDAGAIRLVEQGRLRALAVAYPERWPTLPNLPTMAELGYPEVTLTAFGGIHAPAKTPAHIVDKLSSALMSALTEAEVKKVVLQGNMVSKPMSKQETAEFIKGLTVKWSPIVKSLNISLD